MARYSRRDWLALGRLALAEAGPAALTVEALTARAGKTRGSFYHHFPTHGDFVAALAAEWRRGLADGNKPHCPYDWAVERGMRRLAAAAPAARSEVEAADAARIARLRAAQADPASPAATDYAAIAQAVRLGLLADDRADPERIDRLLRLLDEMIAAHWNE
ncbi:TetR/AcrR family transcriptional regulator [Pikeienuella piscinae]|uniref:TetR/AcrR family transcriptional regulator n=1 Tax=Pikeienuella piscinae TaxID=2748098 RepID=A0A7L5C524_9RHOB|nr:TetR/AcrR family transcriptional regulator [Pikeienuella piscinae]QIE57069.1 TetR/AcrR family transcriptional regulator [Pikeienuella piscinae]